MPMYCPYTFGRLAEVVKSKGAPIIERPNEINIWGVRSNDLQSNAFNDWLTFSYRRDDGVFAFYAFQATTDAGLYWRQNPENAKGVGVLVPGYYPGLWHRGLHRGQYPALVQTGPCDVWRDNNRDAVLDIGSATPIERGVKIGLNLHHARAVGASAQVDKWSAACQVVADADDHAFVMTLVGRQISAGLPDNFGYVLLNERDVS